MQPQLGIDFASGDQNTLVDWAAAKEAGVQFAIFRAASGGRRLDHTWTAEASRARAAGMVVGAYTGASPLSRGPLHWPEALEPQLTPHVDLPPIVDVEFSRGLLKTDRPRVFKQLAALCQAITKTELVQPMLYTSRRVWDTDDADTLHASRNLDPAMAGYFAQLPLWLARYGMVARSPADLRPQVMRPVPPEAWGHRNVWIHQYQGDARKVPGVSHQCDLNAFWPAQRWDVGGTTKWVQRKAGVKQDGSFGPVTEAAVKTAQRNHGLPETGVVDVATFAALAWVDR